MKMYKEKKRKGSVGGKRQLVALATKRKRIIKIRPFGQLKTGNQHAIKWKTKMMSEEWIFQNKPNTSVWNFYLKWSSKFNEKFFQVQMKCQSLAGQVERKTRGWRTLKECCVLPLHVICDFITSSWKMTRPCSYS